MSNLPELTGLFATLASQFETGNAGTSDADKSDDVLVAAVNQSLNLSEQSRVRVLDTALSLMCFTSPQVFDSVIDYSVNTIVSVLSSSIHRNVFRSGKSEVLRIGASITPRDCVTLMESCADVLEKLPDNGTLSRSLLSTIIKVAVMTTQFQYTTQVIPVLNLQSSESTSHALSKLVNYIPKRISIDNQELQLRMLTWHLDPQLLLQNISQILQEITKRPFMCLNEELHENMEWRSVIICLSLSPLMFIETKALLHNWFLHTGLDSVLELQIGITSMLLDLLSRPISWGLSTETGLKLPFSNTYFHSNQLLRTLNQPLSLDGFLELVHRIKDSVSHTKVDHKSTWAIAMNFPDWFHFASLILTGKSFGTLHHTSSSSSTASWYISWILNPINKSFSSNLAEKLEKFTKMCTSQSIRIWLEEFQDSKMINLQKSMMFRRILLGVLIGCYDSINEDGFELVLHYITTGKIQKSTESQHVGFKEAIGGALIVFKLTDIAEMISGDVFETREIAVDFICEIKLKVVKYLIKCVKKLVECEVDEKNGLLFKDLHRRILQWRIQGKDVFVHGKKDLDDVINMIASKLH